MWRGRARRTLRFIAQSSIWGPVVKQALVWEMRGLHRFYLSREVASPLDPNFGPDLLCPASWTVKPFCWRVWYGRGRAPGYCPTPPTSRRSCRPSSQTKPPTSWETKRGEEKHEAFGDGITGAASAAFREESLIYVRRTVKGTVIDCTWTLARMKARLAGNGPVCQRGPACNKGSKCPRPRGDGARPSLLCPFRGASPRP